MKKITSLLMVVAAWLCATVAVADDSTSETTTTFTVATTPTTYENLTTGYYVVKAKAKGNAGFVYHTGDVTSATAANFRINKSITDISSVTDSSYVWYITKTDNGLVFQNAKDGAYLPATASHGGNCNIAPTLANAAVLQSSSWNDSYTGALESGFTLKQMNNNPFSQPLCLHANDYSNEYALSYWEGGSPSDNGSMVMFAAYSITSDFTSSHISKAWAVKETITRNNDGNETTLTNYKALADSSTYEVPDVNIEMSYYYTATKAVTSTNTTVSESNNTFTGTQTITCGTMPFETSTAASPIWYTVKFRNDDARYLVHQATTDNNIGSRIQFSSITDWTKYTGALWAFEKSGNGVKVLCKQTGTYINVENGNNEKKATLSATGSTFIVKTNSSNSSTGFSLKVPNVTNAYIGDHKDGTLAVWNDGSAQNDGGSSWIIAKVDATEAALNVGKNCINALTATEADATYLSAQQEEGATAAKSAISSATTLSVSTLENAYYLYLKPSPEEGAYYRIVNCNAINHKYISSESISVGNDGTLTTAYNADNSINRTISRVTSSDAYLPTVWKLEKQSDGNYLIRNANTGANICDNSNMNMDMPINTSAGGHFALQAVPVSVLSSSDAKTMFQLKLGSNLVNAFGGDNNTIIQQWNSATDLGSYWKFEKVTSVPVTISAANYATVCYPFAVQVADTSNVKAYYTQQVEDGTMTLVEIEDGIIPANTGVVLYHDGATTTTFALTTTEKTLTGNKLDGVTAERTGYTSLETYVLALNSNNKAAFCQSELTVIPANKAYLKASNIGSTTVGTESINFDFNKVDGIGLTPSAEHQRTKYYDLNGRAVPYPVHGIFVTDKGKKVLIP